MSLLYKVSSDKQTRLYLKKIDKEEDDNKFNCRPFGLTPKGYFAAGLATAPLMPYISYKMYKRGQRLNSNAWKAGALAFGGWTGYNTLRFAKEDYDRIKYCKNKNKSK